MRNWNFAETLLFLKGKHCENNSGTLMSVSDIPLCSSRPPFAAQGRGFSTSCVVLAQKPFRRPLAFCNPFRRSLSICHFRLAIQRAGMATVSAPHVPGGADAWGRLRGETGVNLQTVNSGCRFVKELDTQSSELLKRFAWSLMLINSGSGIQLSRLQIGNPTRQLPCRRKPRGASLDGIC